MAVLITLTVVHLERMLREIMTTILILTGVMGKASAADPDLLSIFHINNYHYIDRPYFASHLPK